MDFQKLMKDVCGKLPFYTIHKKLFSTDDTTIYWFDGKIATNQNWYLLKGTDTSGSRSAYKTENDVNKGGIRVKYTFTFSVASMMAPVHATVTGLNERELSKQECSPGQLILEIPGLCWGSNIDICNVHKGYVAFLRLDSKTMNQYMFGFTITITHKYI